MLLSQRVISQVEMGFKHSNSVEEALETTLEEHGKRAKVGVID